MQLFLKTLLLAAFCSAIACSQNNSSGKSSNTETANTPAAVKFDNETDFICGMKVLPEYEDTCHYQGKVYAFCSESCKETFLENPEKYLTGQ